VVGLPFDLRLLALGMVRLSSENRIKRGGGGKMGLRSITCGLRLCLNAFFFHLHILFSSVDHLRSVLFYFISFHSPPLSLVERLAHHLALCGWRCLRFLDVPRPCQSGYRQDSSEGSRRHDHRAKGGIAHLYHGVRCSVQGYSHIASPEPWKKQKMLGSGLLSVW
jgi:hypothetical protein